MCGKHHSYLYLAIAITALSILPSSRAASVIGFAEEITLTSEDALVACVTVNIDPPSNSGIDVEIVAVGGTAKFGEDYAFSYEPWLSIAAGWTNATYCFQIKADCESEDPNGSVAPRFNNPSFQTGLRELCPIRMASSARFSSYGLKLRRLNSDGTLDLQFANPDFPITALRGIAIRPRTETLSMSNFT